jgi:tellurite resistance protein TerC
VLIYFFLGKQKALEFLTAYLVEKSLSIDNIFVFILIFSSLKTPEQFRHRILFWGVLGALVLRGLMIFTGVSLLHHFHFLFYIFGLILIVAGFRMLFHKKEDLETQPIYKWIVKRFPISSEATGGSFLKKLDRKWVLTNLGLTLVLIEASDLVFALDSIPAVLSITPDLFIVYTSNVFAIMGLRSLFFVLIELMEYFHYLPYGLAVILIFIGVRMFLPEPWQISTQFELLTICGILVFSILPSIFFKKVPKVPR